METNLNDTNDFLDEFIYKQNYFVENVFSAQNDTKTEKITLEHDLKNETTDDIVLEIYYYVYDDKVENKQPENSLLKKILKTKFPRKSVLFIEESDDKKNENLIEKEYDNLIDWYNYQISATSKFCNKFDKIVTPDQKILGNCLLDYPKCVAKSIRQLCQCDDKCISKIEKRLIIDDCYLFDPISNFKLFNNTEFLKCCWPWVNKEGNYKYIGQERNIKEARKKLYNSFIDLCSNERKFDVAKCSLHEFLDETPYDIDVFIKDSVIPYQEKCTNVNFNSQIDNFKHVINSRNIKFPLNGKNISKRETGIFSSDIISQSHASDFSILYYGSFFILFGFLLIYIFRNIKKVRKSRF